MARVFHRPLVWVILALGAVVVGWGLRPSLTPKPPVKVSPPPVPPPPVVTSPSQLEHLAAVRVQSPPVAPPPATPVIVSPDYLEAIRQSPEQQEAEEIALNLRHFGQRFGGNPGGTNAEIVKTLNGGNPQGVRYLPQQSLRLNDQGELIDAWGTPYFFHQLSAQETEVRSAGPDRVMWTPDDLLAK